MKKIISILFLLMMLPDIAHAETGQVPFSIAPIFPDNQVEGERGYYDLMVKPGDEQTLQVKLINSTDKEMDIQISANPAATNGNGILIYDGSIKQSSHPFEGLAEVQDKSVKLAPGEVRMTTIRLKAPDKSFDGEILGGLYFLQKSDQDSKDSVQIKNEYAYALAVRLHEKGNNNAVQPELKLKDVKPKIVDHRTAVEATYNNMKPLLMGKMKFKAEVYRENADKPLYAQKIDDFSAAPDSIFNVPLMLDNQPVKPGKYIYKSTFTDGKKKYHFEKPFTVSDKQAEKVNSAAIELDNPVNWWLYTSLALAAIIGLLIYFVVRLSRKTKE